MEGQGRLLMRADRVTLDDIVRAHGAMRQHGRRWRGAPCPVCGGGHRDAFWVEDGAAAVMVGCNQCGEGREFFLSVLNALGLRERRDAVPGPRRRASTAKSQPPAGRQPESSRSDRPARVWAASVPADGTAGAVYLTNRGAWPAESGCLPASVRWIGAAEYSSVDGRPRLPFATFGALVYRFAAPSDLVTHAAQIEAVDDRGERVEFWMGSDRPPAKRVSITGSAFAGGARVFVARAPAPGGEVWLAEGPLDALLLASPGRLPVGVGVVGAAGTGNVKAAAVAGQTGLVVLAADNDAEGEAAAIRVGVELERAGRAWAMRLPPVPGDWLDWAAGAASAGDDVEALETRGDSQ